MITLKCSPDLKIMPSNPHDPDPQDALEEHEPMLSLSSKRTNIYLYAFQRDCFLAAVKAYIAIFG
jgi:hypothetical protein